MIKTSIPNGSTIFQYVARKVQIYDIGRGLVQWRPIKIIGLQIPRMWGPSESGGAASSGERS